MRGLSRWETAVAVAALSKSAVALSAYLGALVVHGGDVTSRAGLMAAHVAVYGAVSVLLFVGGRRDQRAVLLGVVLLLIAETFAGAVGQGLSPLGPTWHVPHAVLRLLQLNAFSPYFLWRFVREFPRVSWFGLKGFAVSTYLRVSLVVGLALLAANFVLGLSAGWAWTLNPAQDPLWFVSRFNPQGAYWTLQYALTIPAAVALLMKTPSAASDERRRVWMLVAGLVLGTLPTTLWVAAVSFYPVVGEVLPLRIAGWVIYPALLTPPFATAHAVLVYKALDVRVVARRAVQYALARYTLGAVAVGPLIWLAAMVYLNRDRSVTELVTSTEGLAIVVLSGVGLSAIVWRRRLLDGVDRAFFPAVYAARSALNELVGRCRVAAGPEELAGTIEDGVAQALAPDAVHVLLLAASAGSYAARNGSHRPLPDTTRIVSLLAESGGILDVDLSRRGTRVRALPEEDRFWLADGGTRLLIAIPDAQGGAAGLLSLGVRQDDLPYTAEDRRLLVEVAKTAGVALQFLSLHGRRPTMRAEQNAVEQDGAAMECMACGGLTAAGEDRCPLCGGRLAASAVPLVLANKFRLVERLGAGGMGVVYRGVDLSLGRPVAVKTLPRTTPGHATRLRQEARAMAAVSHPGLALIFGGESWHGVPMLVFEFLAGGTLADRLTRGRVPPQELVNLGIDLAGAVAAMHRAGILHRDIKPSNIGFTDEGRVKLLDFGLARILGGAREQTGVPVGELHGTRFHMDSRVTHPGLTAAGDGTIHGTPLYLSPEALDGAPPDPGADLWALAVTLYEAAAGRNPLRERSLPLTLLRIADAKIPPLSDLVPDADPALVAFFRSALAKDRRHRPATASEFAARLRPVGAALAA